MFVTRPKLAPLGLDLAKLEGEGSFPSEFQGITTDGRPIHIRYRLGWLSIHLGAVGQGENVTLAEMELLLERYIGPPYASFILPQQVCDLTGITIQGMPPDFSGAEWLAASKKYYLFDWSGRTTYWERQLQVTEHGLQRFFHVLAGRFPDLHILEGTWVAKGRRRYVRRESVSQCEQCATLAFGGSDASLREILSRDHVRQQDLADAFAHTATLSLTGLAYIRRRKRGPYPPDGPFAKSPSVRRFLRPMDEQFSEELGRPVVFAEAASEFVGTRFATGRREGRRFVRAFIAAVEACFSNRVEVVDLRTGAVTDRPEAWSSWHGLDLVEWCRSASDRYLGGFRDKEDRARLMAWRPAPARRG